jgi:hypothetical protein
MPRHIRSTRLSARALPAAAFATIAAAVLAACGGGEKPTGPGGGSNARGLFSGTVSGHVSRPLTGAAFYGQADQEGATGFAVGMGSPGSDQQTYRDLIVIGRERAGVPASGTYTLYNNARDEEPRADQFVLHSILRLPSGGDLLCSGTTGTVTFGAVSGGRLMGSYTTQARCTDPANPAAELSVTLAGSFEAVESTRVPSAMRLPHVSGATRAGATR